MPHRHSWKVAQVVSATLMAAMLPPALHAQAPGPVLEEVDVIIVTGTRRSDRTVADSPVPIDVVDSAMLENQGYAEPNKILNTLIPSFNFPQPSITDGTDVIRPATLRGLGPDQTLVLINGKRRHPTALLNINGSVGRGTAAVDMNMIPAAAIERIEVLRDGAAAQYGSDAIAGVINIVLKSSAEGGSVSTSFGEYITKADGVPNVTGIQTTGAGTPVLASDGTYATLKDGDRSITDGETWSVSGNWGLPLGSAGFINLTAEYRDRSATDRSGADPRQQYAASIATPTTPAAGELGFDRINHRFGDAETQDLTAFVNAGYNLSDRMELYGFATYTQRDGESGGFFRRSGDARNRNFSASTTTFVPYYPDGFLPLIVTDLKDYSLAAGLKGEAGAWNWDVSLVHGSDAFDFGVENSFNTSYGSASQQTFDSGGLRFNQDTFTSTSRDCLMSPSCSLCPSPSVRNTGRRISGSSRATCNRMRAVLSWRTALPQVRRYSPASAPTLMRTGTASRCTWTSMPMSRIAGTWILQPASRTTATSVRI